MTYLKAPYINLIACLSCTAATVDMVDHGQTALATFNLIAVFGNACVVFLALCRASEQP